MRTRRLCGFTLAELIVVISILAILATVGFLALSGYSQDAKSSALKTNIRSVYTAISLESTVSGNSPRYYVIHDPSASLNGVFVYVEGKSFTLTGGAWNAPNTNYSAGGPDFAKLKLNGDKFRISSSGFDRFFSVGDNANAAYDSASMTVGAADVGTTDTTSLYQVAAIDAAGSTVVVGNYVPSGTGSTSGLIDNPTVAGTGALTDGQTVTPGATITATLAASTLPNGKLTKAYNNGAGFDFKTLFSVTGDSAYDSSQIVWSLASGTLPAGLSLGSDGKITGTPTTLNAGATIQVLATYKGVSAQQGYTIVVIDAVLEAVQVANGENFSCAVTPTGGAKCWGDNSLGQLGDGTAVTKLKPVDVSGLTSGVAEIAGGSNFTCALLTNGTVKCWGYNAYGQLGKGSGGNSTTPVAVSGIASGATHVTVGERHACAIVSGAAKCWGYNYHGQLGDSTGTDRNAPVAVTGLSSGVTDLEAGSTHTCAVVSGVAKCWGNNGSYQLGDGTNTNRNVPVNVAGLPSDIVAVSAGSANNSCAMNSAGGLKCWGGLAGDGTVPSRTAPVDVTGMTSGVAQVDCGYSHTCVLTTAGAAKCWGMNGGEGRTGDGITYNATTTVPTAVAGLSSGVAAISANRAGCALLSNGTVKCWSYYAGNNTSNAEYSPVSVME